MSGCITDHAFEWMKQVLLSSEVVTSQAAAAHLLSVLPMLSIPEESRTEDARVHTCCQECVLLSCRVLSFSDVAPVL